MGVLDDAIRDHLDLKRRRGADPAEIERAEREALGPVRREPLATLDSPVDLSDDPSAAREPLVLPDDEAEPFEDLPLDEPSLADDRLPMDDEFVYEDDEPARLEEPTRVEEEPPRRRRRFFGRRVSAETSEAVPPAEPLPPSEFDDDDPFLRHHDEVDPDVSDLPVSSEASTAPSIADEELVEDDPYAPDEDDDDAAADPATRPVSDLSDHTVEYDVERDFDARPETTGRPERPERPPERPRPADDDVLEETPDFLQDAPDHDRLWFEQKPPRDFDFDG